jgi:hypothetical protein
MYFQEQMKPYLYLIPKILSDQLWATSHFS